MTHSNRHFFCGIGGSGMLPLALILLDQGRTPAKFDYIGGKGIRLFPQDGSGVTSPEQIVVAGSAAMQDGITPARAQRS